MNKHSSSIHLLELFAAERREEYLERLDSYVKFLLNFCYAALNINFTKLVKLNLCKPPTKKSYKTLCNITTCNSDPDLL